MEIEPVAQLETRDAPPAGPTPGPSPDPQPGPPPFSRALNMRDLGGALKRRWLLFSVVTLLVTAAALGASLLFTTMWSATAQILIEPNRRTAADLAAQAGGGPPDQAVVDTQVGLMRSRGVAARVVRQLDLVRDAEFNKPPREGARPADPVERTVNGLLDHVDVARADTTYLVGLTVRSVDPAKAATIANAFADQYVASSVETQVGTATQQSATLRRQLADLGAELQAADARAAQYRAGAGIALGATGGTITDQQVAPLSNQLATAEAQAAAARSNLAAARAQIGSGGYEAVSGVLDSAVIADLRRQRAEVLRAQGEATARYGPRHPESVSLAEQLGGIDRQLREESGRIVSGIESEARAASASAASLRAELGRLRGRQAGDTRAAVIAESLERQAEAKRTVYNQLAQAAQQTTQQRVGTEPLGRIVERAKTPVEPGFPNRPLFALLGLFLGLLTALAAVMLAETLNTKIVSSEEVERMLGLPFVASVRRLRLRRGATAWDHVLEKPMSSYAETMRTIRQTLSLDDSGGPSVVAICSSLPGEGKTSLAASLGRAMALSGDRVVLIDCDVRRNALRALAPSDAGGLTELLAGTVGLEDALIVDEPTGLAVLQPARAEFTPRDLFGGDAMAGLIATLRARYDRILLDTPPVLAVADARALARLSDTVLFLVRWNRTSRFAARSALSRLAGDGPKRILAVLTMTEARAGTVSKSDPAYYHKEYASYYQE